MGKIILCTGKIADQAFLFPILDAKVYSIEELCYYIYNNIYSLTSSMFSNDLADFLEQHLAMEKTAAKLRKLIQKKASLKDIVVTILCSADYYEEDEIKALIQVMDKLEKSTPVECLKLKADNNLFMGDYKSAGSAYQTILDQKEKEQYSDFWEGNVYHNLGIVKMYTQTYQDAAASFLTAFEKNKNNESLLAYLINLKFAKKEELFQSEVDRFHITKETVVRIEEELQNAMDEAKGQSDFIEISKTEELKEAGRMEEYYHMLDSTITKWKEEYKNGLI